MTMVEDIEFEALSRDGVLVMSQLFSTELVRRLAADCEQLLQRDQLQPARIGRGGGARLQPGIRGDAMRWIEPDPETPVRAEFLHQLGLLRLRLNRELLLGLDSVEAHYAVYPPGAGYARHIDRFRDDDARMVSFTCYLNEGWPIDAGGALRFWLDGRAVDVLPRLGTCTLFLSAEIEHEVLPATRPRYSIAGWFRRRPLQLV